MNKIIYSNLNAEGIENNSHFKLQYSLLEDDLEIGIYILKCYGFEIKKTAEHGGKTLSEVKQIHNAFFNKNEAAEFLKKIADAKVTPIALSGILEDYISDAIHTKKRLPVLV